MEQIFDTCPSFFVTWLRTWKGLSSVYAFAITITLVTWQRRSEIQFANAFAIAITLSRWRWRSEATVSPTTWLIFFIYFPQHILISSLVTLSIHLIFSMLLYDEVRSFRQMNIQDVWLAVQAAHAGHIDVVKELLDHGANVTMPLVLSPLIRQPVSRLLREHLVSYVFSNITA